jgi:Flp pilus assembly pilin Flp
VGSLRNRKEIQLAYDMLELKVLDQELKSVDGAREMPSPLVRLWKDQSGQDLVEYILLLLLIALMLVASTKSLSQAVGNAFRTVTNTVSAATTGGNSGGNGTGGGGAP